MLLATISKAQHFVYCPSSSCWVKSSNIIDNLNTAYFIAYRIRKPDKKAFSALVHKIGTMSVALGLSIVLVGFLAINGFQQNIQEKLTSFQGQFQVYQYALNRSHEEPPIATTNLQAIKQAFPGTIKSIQPYAHKTALLKAGEVLAGIVFKGIDPQLAHNKFSQYLTAGRFITEHQQGYSHEIVLSSQVAAKLQLTIGQEVIACMVQQPPRYRKLKLVGIYNTYVEAIDDNLAFCDLKLIQRINAWPDTLIGGYEVYLQDPGKTKEVAAQVLDWLDYDLAIQTTQEAYAAIFDWLAIMRKDVLIFLSLILLVASSNMVSIVLIQIMERTQMIGLLKAMGTTDRLIQYIMLWNNLYLLLKGMVWGNILGLGFGFLQSHYRFIRLDPTYYYIHYLPIAWNGKVILLLNVFVFLLVSAVLLLATMLIAKLRPIKAIRFQ